MELRKAFRPKQRWIIHGFRRKPELARQLVDAGFDISIGTKYNPGVPAVVPPGGSTMKQTATGPDDLSLT